jgi:hypothetical protein
MTVEEAESIDYRRAGLEVSFILLQTSGAHQTSYTHSATQPTMPSCINISLVIFISSLVVSMGYILPDTDYQEKQLLQLKQIMEEDHDRNSLQEDLNMQDIPKEDAEYSEPYAVFEDKPTDSEIVSALLAQLDNPAQSKALYDQLVRSKVKKDSEHLSRHQPPNLPTYLLAISDRKTPSISHQRRKRSSQSIPPYLRQSRSN